MLDVVVLIGSALLIYYSCEFFVNGIEWVGRKFDIAENAVGTILAALGTAMPESIVTGIAVIFGVSASQKDIGVGAAMGGPLILSTVAYAVIGGSLFYYRRQKRQSLEVDLGQNDLSKDQLWFLILFLLNIILGVVTFPGKRWMGLVFIVSYIVYCYKEMSRNTSEENLTSLERLKFRPNQQNPETIWVVSQTLLSLILIFTGSQIFVSRMEIISNALQLSPHVLALLLSPMATELPEIVNAIIWIRQGKEMLAISNVSGSMIIQTTIPSALGILFTPWLFDTVLLTAGIVTLAAIVFFWQTLRRERLTPGILGFHSVFYLAFAITMYMLTQKQLMSGL